MIIAADALTRFAQNIIAAAGSATPEAEEVATHLVEANLKGHDSHGVGMIPTYVRNVREGHLKPNQHAVLVSEAGPIAVFEGQMGYGQVIACEATEWAIAKATSAGAAIFALRNTHHVARVGAYGERAAAAGLVSIHFVNVLIAPGRVAPFGGTTGRFGTDPVCIAFPGAAGTPPVVLDFATSRVAAGKLRVALNEGKTLPSGYLIDAEGNEATDPAVFYRGNGAMLPFGEHKGSGLALACELLAGVLTGGGVMQADIPNHGVKNGMFSIVLDPARFGDTGWMQQERERLIAWVKSSPPRPGVEEVMVAGEPERKSRAKRLQTGIPVDDTTWKELVAAARQAGVAASAIPSG
ncbi:MAG TPA: malate/lactate/ureidoglycolate dehydrogenase [Stellaceae bacterium]|nr:malate/lactate/ureidoglycolate dehydrogenase [Stellaceae bacterium]